MPTRLPNTSERYSGASGDFNPWAEVDLKNIKTKKVKAMVGPPGQQTEQIKEMAVCPECGSISCACLARVTLQKRLDEDNAKGVRNADQPDPMAILSQSFNQMSHQSGLSGAAAGFF